MSEEEKVNIKLDRDLANSVKRIAKNKWPLRKIGKYAEAVRETLIEFVKRNQRFNIKEEMENLPSKNQLLEQ